VATVPSPFSRAARLTKRRAYNPSSPNTSLSSLMPGCASLLDFLYLATVPSRHGLFLLCCDAQAEASMAPVIWKIAAAGRTARTPDTIEVRASPGNAGA